jgi:hypothetical protein
MSFLGIKPKRLLKWRGILAMLMFALGVVRVSFDIPYVHLGSTLACNA